MACIMQEGRQPSAARRYCKPTLAFRFSCLHACLCVIFCLQCRLQPVREHVHRYAEASRRRQRHPDVHTLTCEEATVCLQTLTTTTKTDPNIGTSDRWHSLTSSASTNFSFELPLLYLCLLKRGELSTHNYCNGSRPRVSQANLVARSLSCRLSTLSAQLYDFTATTKVLQASSTPSTALCPCTLNALPRQ